MKLTSFKPRVIAHLGLLRRIGLALAGPSLLFITSPAASTQPVEKSDAPLPADDHGVVRRLPAPFPGSWLLLHSDHPGKPDDTRLVIVDPAALNGAYKGFISAPGMLAATALPIRAEIAILTGSSAGLKLRTWDMATLRAKATVTIPNEGREGDDKTDILPLTGGNKIALLFPTSGRLIVADLAHRTTRIVDTAKHGCTRLIAATRAGVLAICNSGKVMQLSLSANGRLIRAAIDPGLPMIAPAAALVRPSGTEQIGFITLGSDALARFTASPDGLLRLSGQSRLTDICANKALAADDAGHVAVLLLADHDNAGSGEVCSTVVVYDRDFPKRSVRIQLRTPTKVMGLVSGSLPLLVSARGDGGIDIYDTASGRLIRKIPVVGSSIVAIFRATEAGR